MPGISDSDYTVRGSLRLAQQRELPDLLDIFVAGGGPCGTAAAFRAAELGLSCLVVDYDDLMSRIRDYPKEKHIYPDYADDESPFPSGDRCVAALHFPEIDKDEMVAGWRGKYREFSIAARVGSELTGLSRDSDGVWNVRTWNHRAQQEVVYRARNVIIGIGAGKPRRFQVPGNLDGISFRLDDAKQYVGAPALVFGGGTSAAEAVIGISNAKAAAGDKTAVYWSYRQEQMPRVEKSLSGAFFDAYVGNGNVRYLPWSEPILVLTAPDKKEYLSVRIDRKIVEGRPVESVHLEFPKEQVVACIGADVPHHTLQKFGIKVPTIDGEPYMLVTEDGETSLPGVFLAGDVKGTPEYYRCTDFNDPQTYKKKRDRRTIKMAMRDAVHAVEVIAARAGKGDMPVAQASAPAPTVDADATHIVTSPFRDAALQPDAGVQLLTLLPDGSVETAYPLKAEVTRIGRKTDGITFDDVYMADHHATLSKQDGHYLLSDTTDGSGVWLRVRGAGRLLEADDQVWMGGQFLRVTHDAGRWGVEHYNSKGELQGTYQIDEKGMTLGRAADVSLDSRDRSLSRGHARLVAESNQVRVIDIGSTNGTFVRLTAPTVLVSGDEFRLATRRLRFEAFASDEPLLPGAAVIDVPLARPLATALEPQTAIGGPLVSFDDAKHPVSFAVPAERDVLHGFFDYLKAKDPDVDLKRCGRDKGQRCPDDHYKEPLDWSCECGTCGYCAVQVLQGAENVVPADNPDLEKNTLQNTRRISPDLSKYRLACLLRLQGPVTLKLPPKS